MAAPPRVTGGGPNGSRPSPWRPHRVATLASQAWAATGREKEEACTRRAGADDGFTASRCGLSGTGFLNEAASRWADCLRPMEIEWRDRLPVDPRGMVSSGSGVVSLG